MGDLFFRGAKDLATSFLLYLSMGKMDRMKLTDQERKYLETCGEKYRNMIKKS